MSPYTDLFNTYTFLSGDVHFEKQTIVYIYINGNGTVTPVDFCSCADTVQMCFKLHICLGLFFRQNKKYEDVTSGLWKIVMIISNQTKLNESNKKIVIVIQRDGSIRYSGSFTLAASPEEQL